jgi:hypothetical protein
MWLQLGDEEGVDPVETVTEGVPGGGVGQADVGVGGARAEVPAGA